LLLTIGGQKVFVNQSEFAIVPADVPLARRAIGPS
jgi:hypothetical protein